MLARSSANGALPLPGGPSIRCCFVRAVALPALVRGEGIENQVQLVGARKSSTSSSVVRRTLRVGLWACAVALCSGTKPRA